MSTETRPVVVSSAAGAFPDTEKREILTLGVIGGVAPVGGLRPTTTEASCVGLDPVVNSIAFHMPSLTVEPPVTVLGRLLITTSACSAEHGRPRSTPAATSPRAMRRISFEIPAARLLQPRVAFFSFFMAG